MRTLDRKLLRDLKRLRGQVATIAVVVACGIASFVTLRSTWSSLEVSKQTYYARYRFADVFTTVVRAPESVAARLEAIDGVAAVDTRIVRPILLPIEGLLEPASALLISLPGRGEARLNGVFIRAGRRPEAGRPDEVVVNEPFALAWDLAPGDELPAVIGGRERRLRIVGIGLSPEYVFAVRPGELTADDRRFAVMWMERSVMAPAFQMEGAWNDVSLALQPGASLAAVLARIDAILAPYGAVGAVGRDKQLSSYMLEGELAQLEQFATAIPFIFLAVAAFLLNVVLSRLINLQRQQIAVLKAVGYSGWRIGLHYLELVSVIAVLGSVAGVALGAWLGAEMTALYGRFFRFPILEHHLDFSVIATAVGVSLAAGAAGALLSVRQVVRLPAAEAMRPPAPPTYRRGWLERFGLERILGPAGTMVWREIRRRPLRTAASALAIAAAIGIVIVGRFGADAFDVLVDQILDRERPGDVSVAFIDPAPAPIEATLAGLPGVIAAEGHRAVPVRVRAGHRWRDTAVLGLPEEPKLRHIVDRSLEIVRLPRRGLAISAKLAELLDVEVGDSIELEIREGRRRVHRAEIAALIDDAFGLQTYMTLPSLDALLGEERAFTAVELVIDPAQSDLFFRRLQELPGIAGATRKQAMIDSFNEQSGSTMLVMTLILSMFGVAIAVGVVYNNARVALSLRSRDLASLRVIGFSRAEISAVLLGELSVQMLAAIPLGLLLGTWWSRAIMATADPENYRLPIYISPRSYAFAIVVAAVSGVISALLVRRKLDRLDLIGVLKTRE